MAKELKELTKRSENYSQWYNDLVVKADLASLRFYGSILAHPPLIRPFGPPSP